MARAGRKAALIEHARKWLTTTALVAACLVFANQVDEHYPLRHWLFPRYAKYWAMCLGMSAACLVSGMRAVALLGGKSLRLGDHLLLSFASGVLIFSLGIFGGGLLGIYGRAFFFGWPAALLLAAGREPWAQLGRIGKRALDAAGSGEPMFWPRTPLEYARAAFLVVSLVALYLQVLTPENVSFDARWYHLSIAEEYAHQGSIRRFAEGWYLGAYPQLATWLYTWAFMQPGSLFDKVTLASHIEWFLFLATVPGVGLLARHVLPNVRLRWVGATLFLFPSLFLYDTNLTSSADHVLAFWAIPMAIAAIAVASAPSVRRILLVSIPAAGAVLTRYQAIYMLVPLGAVMLVALIRKRRIVLVLPGVASLLVLSAPHWLKNLIYYGDPLYPMLHDYLPSHPFHRGATDAMQGVYVPTNFSLSGTLGERITQTLYALPTFSFEPNNWGNLNLPEPTFGSLFTLLGLALPFIARAGRIWLLTLCTYVGVGIWFWTNHQDRFLQALLPWMAVCVAALCARIWRIGLAPRLSLCALVGFQLVWGADFWFSPNHTIMHDSIVVSLARHLRAGKEGKYAERFRHWGDLYKVAEVLPEDAVVLMHGGGFRLGLDRWIVSDEYGYQGALSYEELGNARAVWQAWHDLGVTHVLWSRSDRKDMNRRESAREAVFQKAVKKVTRNRRRVRGDYVAELLPEPP